MITYDPSDEQQASFDAFLAANPAIEPLGNNITSPDRRILHRPAGLPPVPSPELPAHRTPFKLDAPVDTVVEC